MPTVNKACSKLASILKALPINTPQRTTLALAIQEVVLEAAELGYQTGAQEAADCAEQQKQQQWGRAFWMYCEPMCN